MVVAKDNICVMSVQSTRHLPFYILLHWNLLTMFRYFSFGVYYLQGGILVVAMADALLNYRKGIEGLTISFQELEAITSGSNAGAACVITRMEHCFIFFAATLLLIVGHYVPVEQRGVPSLAVATCCFIAAQSEFAIASNTFDIQVYQGSFTELLGKVAYLNLGFGILHSMVSVGTFAGLAKSPHKGTKLE